MRRGRLSAKVTTKARGSECGCQRRPAFHGLLDFRSLISSSWRRSGFLRTPMFFSSRVIRRGSPEHGTDHVSLVVKSDAV
uniref:Uncharacterized protein n=1 Tax=Arundo donax TaxID=35708 RepID=A0A0A9A2C5_ARUDO